MTTWANSYVVGIHENFNIFSIIHHDIKILFALIITYTFGIYKTSTSYRLLLKDLFISSSWTNYFRFQLLRSVIKLIYTVVYPRYYEYSHVFLLSLISFLSYVLLCILFILLLYALSYYCSLKFTITKSESCLLKLFVQSRRFLNDRVKALPFRSFTIQLQFGISYSDCD